MIGPPEIFALELCTINDESNYSDDEHLLKSMDNKSRPCENCATFKAKIQNKERQLLDIQDKLYRIKTSRNTLRNPVPRINSSSVISLIIYVHQIQNIRSIFNGNTIVDGTF